MEYNNHYFDELASFDEIPNPITPNWLRALGVYIKTSQHKNPIVEDYLYLRLYHEAENLREYELAKAEGEHKKSGTLTPLNPHLKQIKATEAVIDISNLMAENHNLTYTQAREQVAESYHFSDKTLYRLLNEFEATKGLVDGIKNPIRKDEN